MWNLVSETINSCPPALSSSASYSTVILTAKSSSLDLTGMAKPIARDSNENSASSCQVWQSDANPSSSAGTLVVKTTKNFRWYKIALPQFGHITKQRRVP